MKHRFFIDGTDITGSEIVLTGKNATHASVLRLLPGEEIVICDDASIDYSCVVVSCDKLETKAKILSKTPNIAEPTVVITLFQALPKASKMDDIIEKCTQLGVSHIVPVITARCVAKTSDRGTKKTERWQKIAHSAASQSQRGCIPQINNVMTFEAALQQAKTHCVSFACYEDEKRFTLKSLLQGLAQNLSSIAFFIGSEGGFTDSEVAKFKESDVPTVSLGSRILRTELAGAVALANILYELDSV